MGIKGEGGELRRNSYFCSQLIKVQECFILAKMSVTTGNTPNK